MIANDVVMSRIVYLIQLYGSTPDYLLKSLQTLQNQAASYKTEVGNKDINSPESSWMAVHKTADCLSQADSRLQNKQR